MTELILHNSAELGLEVKGTKLVIAITFDAAGSKIARERVFNKQ